MATFGRARQLEEKQERWHNPLPSLLMCPLFIDVAHYRSLLKGGAGRDITYAEEVSSTMEVAKERKAGGGGSGSTPWDAGLPPLSSHPKFTAAPAHPALHPPGDIHGALFLAECQTKGMGRRARAWHSPAGGNLYLSMIWSPPHLQAAEAATVLDEMFKLNFAISVATAKAYEAMGVSLSRWCSGRCCARNSMCALNTNSLCVIRSLCCLGRM